jgi:hypothetical protein
MRSTTRILRKKALKATVSSTLRTNQSTTDLLLLNEENQLMWVGRKLLTIRNFGTSTSMTLRIRLTERRRYPIMPRIASRTEGLENLDLTVRPFCWRKLRRINKRRQSTLEWQNNFPEI